MRRDVVAVARERRAPRNHLLARLAEGRDGARELLQGRLAGAGHRVEFQHQRLDAPILLRRVDGVGHVAQQGLVLTETARLGDRAVERIAGALLDDLALGLDHERGFRRQARDAGAQRADHEAENQQQQQQVQDLAQAIEAAQQDAEE